MLAEVKKEKLEMPRDIGKSKDHSRIVQQAADPKTGVDIYERHKNVPGLALIINNCNFDMDIPDRMGSEKDAADLKSVLEQMKFKVKPYANLKAKTMVEKVKKFMKKNEQELKQADSVIVAVMSHGDHGDVIAGTDGKVVSVNDIIYPFIANKIFEEKPKIFIFQACRGGLAGRTVTPVDWKQPAAVVTNKNFSGTTIPQHTDIIVFYSTMPGHLSFKDCEGSWFIQDLCDVLAAEAHHLPLFSLLTRVCNLVSKRADRVDPSIKQVPQIFTQPRKDFYFNPGFPKLTN